MKKLRAIKFRKVSYLIIISILSMGWLGDRQSSRHDPGNISAGYGIPENPVKRSPKEMGITATSGSPYAKLHDIPVSAVTLNEGFWKDRLDRLRDDGIRHQYQMLEEYGWLDNYRRINGKLDPGTVPRRGSLWTDADVTWYIEALASFQRIYEDAWINRNMKETTELVLSIQKENGFMHTGYTEKVLLTGTCHMQLYTIHHLVLAGIYEYRRTGDPYLMNRAIKYLKFVMDNLGPGKKPVHEGHPGIEMALVELYRTTGNKEYLEYADYLINSELPESFYKQLEDARTLHTGFGIRPIKKQDHIWGHAVQATYACAGAADLYLENGDKELLNTLENLWEDLVYSKMYVPGLIGSRHSNEGFGFKYELPNEYGYLETCSAVGNMIWNWRMLQISGNCKYADIIELALYNGIMGGMGLDTKSFFYQNPLSVDNSTRYGTPFHGHHELSHPMNSEAHVRYPWFDIACCPANILRTLPQIPGYMYNTSKEGIWLNLYENSRFEWQTDQGIQVTILQQTDYPFDGDINLDISAGSESVFSVFLRIPGWTRKATVFVNGKAVKGVPQPGTYFEINRLWTKNDKVKIQLDMTPRVVFPNPRIPSANGRVAIQYGPHIYCLESIDNKDISIFDLELVIPENKPSVNIKVSDNRYEKAPVLEIKAKTYDPLINRPLYSFQRFSGNNKEIIVKAIPYAFWANRGVSDMMVWIPYVSK